MSPKHAAYGLPYPSPSSEAVTASMQSNRQVDTTPERVIRSALHRLGYRFRKDYRARVGGRSARLDIAFPVEGLAVFIDGCFWHQCPEHGTVPKSNKDYWAPKLRRNVERDARTSRDLRRAGWTVLRIWEHVPSDAATELICQAIQDLRARAWRRETAAGGKAVDLFAGAGGSTVGLKQAGFDVVGAIESDRDAAGTYAENHRDVELFEGDIREVSPIEFRDALRLRRGELDMLNACPPCQGFSTLGVGNVEDERNTLVSIVLPFIDALLPRGFVLENVPGLRGDRRLDALLSEARALGYAVETYIVNAVDFGVPQRRRRVIAVGVYSRDEDAFPDDLLELLPRSFRREPPPILEVLAEAGPILGTRDPVHRARKNSPTVQQRLRSIPLNGGRFDLPAVQQLACHKSLGRRRNATSAYGRLRLDEPAPTLTTRCTTPACGRFVHPTEHRGISLREAALIQTFPRRYRFSGTYQAIEAQIGNAVPARLAAGLGLAVAELLLGWGDA